MTDPGQPEAYASLLRRYQALLLDGVLYLVIIALGVLVPDLLGLGRRGTGVCFGAAIAVLVGYEPLLVGLRGGTLGHFRYRIRVWDATSGGPIGVRRAFGRAAVKGILGIVSMVLMLVTTRAQALHDLLFHAIVVPADRGAASATDLFVPDQASPTDLHSPRRRIAVITAYSGLTYIGISFLEALVVSSHCVERGICNSAEVWVSWILGLGWLSASLAYVVLGWRGRLLGCRRGAPSEPSVD